MAAELTRCEEDGAPVAIGSGELATERLLDAAKPLVVTVWPKVVAIACDERLEARPSAALGIARWRASWRARRAWVGEGKGEGEREGTIYELGGAKTWPRRRIWRRTWHWPSWRRGSVKLESTLSPTGEKGGKGQRVGGDRICAVGARVRKRKAQDFGGGTGGCGRWLPARGRKRF
ncbi:hypothetical protein E2562_033145 [Oryza meyeriana var. granulata]|uniref:Uncharacterized protein n=1 Tax=Oryza meyeriana var. granulata TaxID=110450 RepID=A0A6G1CKD1_9ORYZ|nr:hypothetical protein E2562_033145 [Oryza meyeriana var. granulata]